MARLEKTGTKVPVKFRGDFQINRGKQMIPKDSTPVKHKILIDIFAKRLLTLDEIAIASYIMRWSWGFDDGERRRDWTKKLIKRKIADDIDMNRGKCCTILNKMIKEKKVRVKNKYYQFNEHYEEWQKFTKGKLSNDKKVYERETKSLRKVNLKVTKGKLKVYERETLGMPNNQGESIKNKDVRGGEHLSKDTLKDRRKKGKDRLRFYIIEYLNKITGAKYKTNTPVTVKNINARLKEGFTLENFKYVIDVKWNEWKGKFTKDGKSCEDWMRPITLFGTKFEGYLNQAKPDPYKKYYGKE